MSSNILSALSALAALPFICSLYYLKAPRIAEQMPATQSAMSIGFYQMAKPTVIEKTMYSKSMVDGDSKAEVECSYTSILPSTLAPRILFNGYEAVCNTNALQLPKPIGTNLFPVPARLSPKNIVLSPIGNNPIPLKTARFSYAHIKRSTGTGIGTITLHDGTVYEATLDDEMNEDVTDLVVKNDRVVRYRRAKGLVPSSACTDEQGNRAVPYGVYDLRNCFKQLPNR